MQERIDGLWDKLLEIVMIRAILVLELDAEEALSAGLGELSCCDIEPDTVYVADQ